jgi:hypothetical protein
MLGKSPDLNNTSSQSNVATNAVCRHTIHVTLIRSNLPDFYTFSQIHVLFVKSWCNLLELFGQTCDKIVFKEYLSS